MCFSATASFTAATILIPAGIYAAKKSSRLNKPYWAIALLPLIFGIQQIFEGLVWLEIEPGGGGSTRMASLGFMFYSHLFWLAWIPFACFVIEHKPLKRKLFFVLILIGSIHGLLMYLPLWFNLDWLLVELVGRSIDYKATLLYDDYLPRIVVRILYALIVLIPLLLCSDRYIKFFGFMVAASVAIATIFFGYAFISIWCYFAAILSLYIIFMLSRIK